MISLGEIYLAASSSEITPFHVTNSLMNCWQKLPSDLTFFFFDSFFEFLFVLTPFFGLLPFLSSASSSESMIISTNRSKRLGSE